MNGTMKLFLELVAKNGGFNRELSNSKSAVTRFTSGAKREFDSLRNSARGLRGTLAGIGLTIGAGKLIMDSARLDKSLTQIGQTAGAGADKVAVLRKDLFRLGRESGQGIEDLKGGFDALVQSGLNMKEAKSTLDGINVAMAVTGANAQTLSGGLTVAATAFQFDLAKPGQALALLDKMTVAGRLGNAELQNLSDIFARVGVNAKSAGMDFDKTLAFIEGLSKVERQPERLATLADSTLRVFTNANYMKAAQKATGIRFFDSKGARRDSMAVLDDLKKKYDTLKTDKQRFEFISKAFGKADLDTIKGIKTLMSGDILPQVKEFSKTIKDAGGTLKHDFSDATRNLIDQTGMLKNDLRQAADGFIKPINEFMGQFIQFLRAKKSDGGLGLDGKDMIKGGLGIAVGTFLLSRYGSKGISAVAGKMLSKGGNLVGGVAEGKVLQAAAGVTPVFVVNMPAGGIVPTGGPGPVAGKAGWLSGAIPFLSTAGIATIPAAFMALTAIGSRYLGGALAENQAKSASVAQLKEWRMNHMVLGGGPGTFQVKTIDTELARRGGSIAGPVTGPRHIDAETMRLLTGKGKNEIKININIDDKGKTIVTTDNMNTRTQVNSMRRGGFDFAAGGLLGGIKH